MTVITAGRPAPSTPPARPLQAVMRNGFRTPLGVLTVAGLFGCPLWLWARRVAAGLNSAANPGQGPLAQLIQLLAWGGWGWVVVPGRLVAAAVELWVVYRHLSRLAQQDVRCEGKGRMQVRGGE